MSEKKRPDRGSLQNASFARTPTRVFVVLSVLWCNISGVAALEVGDDAPAWVNPDLGGEYIFSRDYYGKAPVLLDFYATWCVNCNEKLPEIEALYEKYGPMGLNVLLFAIDTEGSEVVEPFFRNRPTSIPVLIDRYLVTLNKKFGENTVPVYYLIGLNGEILYRGTDVKALAFLLAGIFGGEE